MKPNPIELRQLLEGIARVPGVANRMIQGLQIDSRRICPGELFIAFPGKQSDGRNFINDAVRAGACAVVYESGDGYALHGASVPVVGVHDLDQKLGEIADRLYGSPSQRIVVVGVTGTNGKTTCTHLLAQALDQAPQRCAVIGTLGTGFPGALETSLHTTPDAVTVHRLMAEFVDDGASHVAMEVSSHALDQGRVNGVRFHVAVFTNLTRDHMDYHGDMAAYGLAKSKLFATQGLNCVVINHDDAFGRTLLQDVRPPVSRMSYGVEGGDVRAREIRPTPEGLWLNIETPDGDVTLQSPLIGHFNVYNLLAVFTTLLALGVDRIDAAKRLARATAPMGRAERFGRMDQLPQVVVDYAHTPDALEKILLALREHTPGKLWCVFGCGGDRDRGKRPLMGDIADRLADVVLLTDDNPRHESGDAIIRDIVDGMRRKPQIIRDRRAAIELAIRSAKAGDLVLVAGKGHEAYQQVGDDRLPYSDRDVVQSVLGAAA